MNAYQNFNPYQENHDIMRSFFAKPITLFLAIAYCVQTVVELILPLFVRSEPGINISVNIIPVMMAIGFFMLYFKSHSSKESVNFSPAIVILQVPTIISLVLFSIVGVLLILLLVFSIAQPAMLWIVLLGLFLESAALFSQIGLLTLLSSFKKNFSNIYLRKKGALLTAISNIAAVTASITVLVFNGFLQKAIIGIFENYVPSEYIEMTGVTSTALISTFISTAATTLPAVLLIVFAILYYMYIKKISEGIKVRTPRKRVNVNEEIAVAAPTPVVTNFQPQPVVFLRDEPDDDLEVEEFVPEPVFTGSQPINLPPAEEPKATITEESQQKSTFLYENGFEFNFGPIVTPESPKLNEISTEINNAVSNEIACPTCGTPRNSNAPFCGHCGYKFD